MENLMSRSVVYQRLVVPSLRASVVVAYQSVSLRYASREAVDARPSDDVDMLVQMVPSQYRRSPFTSVMVATSWRSSIELSDRSSAVRGVC